MSNGDINKDAIAWTVFRLNSNGLIEMILVPFVRHSGVRVCPNLHCSQPELFQVPLFQQPCRYHFIPVALDCRCGTQVCWWRPFSYQELNEESCTRRAVYLRIISVGQRLNERIPIVRVLAFVLTKSSRDRFVVSFHFPILLRVIYRSRQQFCTQINAR